MPAKSYVYDGVSSWISSSLTDVTTTPPPPTNPRNTLVYGTYKPDATTTGPLPDITLTVYGDPSTSTNYNATADNEIIENMEIWGSVMLNAYNNVTVRNCLIHGSTDRTGLYPSHVCASNNNLRGAIIEDCKFAGRPITIPATYLGVAQPDAGTVNRANEWCGGITGSNYTISRTEITNVSDGLDFTTSQGNVTVQGCWIHGGWFNEWTPDRGSTSDGTVENGGLKFYPYSHGTTNYTHVDGIQFYVAQNFTIVGNNIGGSRIGGTHNATPSQKDQINSGDDMYNSCILLKQEVSNSPEYSIQNVIIDRNWMQGGACSLNVTFDQGNNFPTAYITNNRFLESPDAIGAQYTCLRAEDNGVGVANFSNNVYDDTGLPILISNGGNTVT